MIPLYGFLEGDTIGLLVLALPDDTVASLAERLERAASVRVAPRGALVLEKSGMILDAALTVAAAGLAPLDRIDARRAEATP
jgi:hypothetical protein